MVQNIDNMTECDLASFVNFLKYKERTLDGDFLDLEYGSDKLDEILKEFENVDVDEDN